MHKYGRCSLVSVCLLFVQISQGRGQPLGLGQDCSQHRDLCDDVSRTCDASLKCRLKAGRYCHNTDAVICVAGAECVKTTARRYARRCDCIDGVSIRDNTTNICKPLPGKILGACVNGAACDDPNARCNTTSQVCECGPNTTMDPTTLSCDLNVGQNCAGTTKKKLCVAGTICGKDKICRVLGGESCAGEKQTLCEQGTVCIDGTCKSDFGIVVTKGRAVCRPESVFSNYVCWIRIGESCKTVKNVCYSRLYHSDRSLDNPGHCDPVTDTCRLLLNSSRCVGHSECPPGALCMSSKCQCAYTGESFAPNKDRVCGIPRGMVGAQCGTAQSPTGCLDPNARCKNKTGLCVCNTGYDEDINHATCGSLSGPKCTFYGQGVIKTFFNEDVEVALPCRFKLADFKCGGVAVAVYADKSKTAVAGVTVHLKRKSSQHSYAIGAKALVSSGTWTKTCLTDQCQEDDRVQPVVTSGLASLQRDLLKVTYRASSVHIECGHRKFKGKESFPDVLCGGPKDTSSVLSDFREKMELEAKANMPDTFGFMTESAFQTRRMTDRAVLVVQNVAQSNPLCAEASSVVSGQCPGRIENMYNCSHVIDDDHFRSSHGFDIRTYTACFGTTIDPFQVYVSCLRVMCDRNATDVSSDTCRTLQQAADLCDDNVGFGVRMFWRRHSGPYMKIGELLGQQSRCPKNTTTT
ncbi:uncharacterized protein [Littorina saxatilis]|uniref:uncharacterized protein n=1 Tax=Littorina saxatilis TaxID=31220 RepID=UPI0038B59BEC